MPDQLKKEDFARPLNGDTGKLDLLENTPLIPDEIYLYLPKLLKKACKVFKNKRERDLMLLSTLPVLARIMSNVKGLYDNRMVHPNLYIIIVAPAASGKSAMKFAKALGMVLHNIWMKESQPGNFKILFIPGNSSNAAMVKHLHENDGKGVLFESEIDTVALTSKNDWGNNSDMLRKGFHEEPITVSRKTNNEFIEVASPQISMAFSGTPNQVTGLIPSVENGLFSRCLYYMFKSEPNWRPVNPEKERLDFDAYFAELGEVVANMYNALSNSPTEVMLEDYQCGNIPGLIGHLIHLDQ